MAKYELSDEQVVTLKNILDNINIKGSQAELIIKLKEALDKPVEEGIKANGSK